MDLSSLYNRYYCILEEQKLLVTLFVENMMSFEAFFTIISNYFVY